MSAVECESKRGLPITSEEIEIYQKLSQFCPLKTDLAELKISINLMSSSISKVDDRLASLEKVLVEHKVLESELNYLKESIKKIEKDISVERGDSVKKKDITIYLTIGGLIIAVLSSIIGVVLAKLI